MPTIASHTPLDETEHNYLQSQFNKKINKESGVRPEGEHYSEITDDCWIWTGTKDSKGYGHYQTDLAKKLGIQFAHRLSVYFNKPEEYKDELCVLHKCDNPSCVNPSHLRVGTKDENNKDRNNKGRTVANTGVDNGWSIFTEEQVKYIREEVQKGRTQKSIAEELKCSPSTIKTLISGQSYDRVITEVPTKVDLVFEEFKKLYNSGLTGKQIVSQMKTSTSTVARLFKKWQEEDPDFKKRGRWASI